MLSWSGDIHIGTIVEDVGTWIGVLAFGIGYTLGTTLEPFGRRARSRRLDYASRRSAGDA